MVGRGADQGGARAGVVQVLVNGGPRQVAAGTTVARLVADLGRDPSGPGLAVAVNDAVVTRGAWARRQLEDGDRVEVLVAAQGG